MSFFRYVLGCLLFVQLLIGDATAQEGQCVVAKRPAPETRVYRVGVMAIRGIETAFKEFNQTFGDYLSFTVGNQFDPPIEFETVPVAFGDIVDELSSFDFVFANPSVFSCIESEIGASSLVSQVARRKVGGEEFSLTQFGGVIFAKADNNRVNTIEDIKGKRVATASITGLGSGQMQFRELQRAGLHHLQDPEQLIFTGNQGKVVQSVLNGQVDVGFVRTDQLERSTDPSTGELLDLSKIKIIGPREGLISNGEPFPFSTSTSLYPEWNLASLPHVRADVAREVQSVLLAMAEHAAIAPDLLSCYDTSNCSSIADDALCFDNCFTSLDQSIFKRCDTTDSLALRAYDAMSSGKYSGWRSTLSYMELRSMQEEIRFINRNEETMEVRCVRSVEIADAVVCPPDHFKKSDEEIVAGCDAAGIDCHGYQCLCSPCVRAFDVDFFPTTDLSTNMALAGCGKFTVCGVVAQANDITFRAIDNKARNDTVFSANVITEDESETYEMDRVANTSLIAHEFTFDATSRRVGVVIIEVYADGVQIGESPFRLQVIERDCEEDNDDSTRVPDPTGQCVCGDNTIEIGKRCIPLGVILPSTLLPIAALLTVLVYLYGEKKRKQADSVWKVTADELIFQDPPQVLGRGTFGLVLLAEYRGTQVAVKRVLPPKEEVAANRSHDGNVQKATSSQLDYGELESGMRSITSSNPVVDREQPLQDDRRKGETSAVAGSASEDPHLRERLHRYLGKGTDSAKAATGPPDDGSGKQTDQDTPQKSTSQKNKNNLKSYFDYDVFNRSATVSGTASKSQISQTDDGTNITDDFGFRTGTFGGSSSGGRSGSRRYPWKQSQYIKMQTDFVEEMRHLSKLRHPCITTVMGAVISRNSEPMLVMEYMQLGSLYDLLHNETMELEGELVLQILRDIAQGLRFLHAATPKVIHGDLKSQNILVDSKFHTKVADFGLSQKKESHRSGTPLWMAPELLRGETSNTSSSDIYSFGMILYEVFSRKDPYEGENHRDVLRMIADKKINKRPPVPRSCPPKAAELMQKCLQGEPGDRPAAEEIDAVLKLMDVANVDSGSNIYSRHNNRKSGQTARTEDLLYQLFPKHVAEALRDGRKVETESFKCVTVFFSDIVGFTNISSKFSSEKIANLLDRFFTKFDELSRIHNVFKVETIGDAYMTVTNLHVEQPDHARIMALFAIDAVEAASSTVIDEDDPSQGYVQIRVGFHSGPVVASVCGSMSPRYTLIGDTVNTASRMESNSLPGRIHCSESSAKLLGDNCPDLKVVSRGKMNIKGKGEMRTFWVKSPNAPSTSANPLNAALGGLEPVPEAPSNLEKSSEHLRRSPTGMDGSRHGKKSLDGSRHGSRHGKNSLDDSIHKKVKRFISTPFESLSNVFNKPEEEFSEAVSFALNNMPEEPLPSGSNSGRASKIIPDDSSKEKRSETTPDSYFFF
jgi:serine/threonine protein kinase